MGGFFDSITSGISDFFSGGGGDVVSAASDVADKSSGGFFSNLFGTTTGIASLITAGTSLIQGYQEQEMYEEKLKKEEELAKYGALLDLAKLKYQLAGKGGGGGGGGGNKEAQRIQTIELKKRGEQDAIKDLMQGLQGAFG